MKTLIINADDLGMEVEIDHRIFQGVESGVVGSVSLIANTPTMELAVTRAKEFPHLSVGVHLNLSRGEPVSPSSRVPSLIASEGRFPQDSKEFMKLLLRGNLRRHDIRVEWEAQIAKVIDSGLRPSHLDGHHHVHLLPHLQSIVIDLAGRFGIGAVRLPRRLFRETHSESLAQKAKWHGLPLFSRYGWRNAGHLARSETYIELPPGLGNPAAYAAVLRRTMPLLREGHTELACHPGYAGRLGTSPQDSGPDPELAALGDPEWRKSLQEQNVHLVGNDRS